MITPIEPFAHAAAPVRVLEMLTTGKSCFGVLESLLRFRGAELYEAVIDCPGAKKKFRATGATPEEAVFQCYVMHHNDFMGTTTDAGKVRLDPAALAGVMLGNQKRDHQPTPPEPKNESMAWKLVFICLSVSCTLLAIYWACKALLP